MRQPFRRRNGHSFDTEAFIARQPRWLSNPWVGKLSSTYERVTNGVSNWISRRIRTWESQTSVSRRRRQVLLLFGVIGLGWVIRLIYLFYQLPALTALVPAVGKLTNTTHSGRAVSRQGSLADSVHKADYLEARSAVTRRSNDSSLHQHPQPNNN